MCYGKRMDETWKKNADEDASTMWQYFASAQGTLQTFPARAFGDHCLDPEHMQDPRTLKWCAVRYRAALANELCHACRYVHAVSGPKDIIILLDKSGSMSQREDIPGAP